MCCFYLGFVKHFEKTNKKTKSTQNARASEKHKNSFHLQQCVPNERTHYNFSFRWVAYDIGIIRKRDWYRYAIIPNNIRCTHHLISFVKILAGSDRNDGRIYWINSVEIVIWIVTNICIYFCSFVSVVVIEWVLFSLWRNDNIESVVRRFNMGSRKPHKLNEWQLLFDVKYYTHDHHYSG